MAGDVGEAEVAALEFVDEFLVLDAHQVQHRCVEIVHVHAAIENVVAIFIGEAVRDALFHASTGEPDAEATGVVISTVVVAAHFSLAVGGATKLAAPDDESVIEQTATFEVHHQCGGGLVGLLALARNPAHHVTVLVPALVEELDKPDIAFDQSTSEQAVRGVGAGRAGIGAVKVKSLIRFTREIRGIGHAGLHAECHLGLSDAGVDFGIELLRGLIAIELAESIEHAATRMRRYALGIGEIKHRLLARAKLHALVFAGEETRAPEAGVERLIALGIFRDQHDEAREIVVEAAEAVRGPSTHRRATGDLAAGAEKGDRGVVIDGFRVHAADHTNFIGDFLRVRQNVADRHARISALGEIGERSRHRQRALIATHRRKTLVANDRLRQGLAVALAQQWLVIERFQVRGTAGLEQIDHALDLGEVMRRAEDACGRSRGSACAKHLCHRHGAESETRATEEMTTRLHHQLIIRRRCRFHKKRCG